MKFLLWKHRSKLAELDEIERQAEQVHQENISEISAERQKVDKLNVVLKQNHIVFELAHVIGNGK
jgi:hypothetical protein